SRCVIARLGLAPEFPKVQASVSARDFHLAAAKAVQFADVRSWLLDYQLLDLTESAMGLDCRKVDLTQLQRDSAPASAIAAQAESGSVPYFRKADLIESLLASVVGSRLPAERRTW